MSVAERGN